MTQVIDKSDMTLYGLGVTSPVFLTLEEYEHFPEDGICGEARNHYYMNYEGITPVEYFNEFDGLTDVFKETSKDGEVTFYHLDTEHSHPRVYEGKIVDGDITWDESGLEAEDLRDAYEYFRLHGICFHNDYFARIDYENHIREQQTLARIQLLDEYMSSVNAVLSRHSISKNSEELPSVGSNPIKKAIRFIFKGK